MNKYIIVLEYQIEEFMNINKIFTFNQNLKKVEEKGNIINLVLYGNYPKEELAICMSYLNKLLREEICEMSISTKTKEICYVKEKNKFFEGGNNHKSVKISNKNIKEIKNKNFDNIDFDNIIKDHYSKEDIIIKYWTTKNWESNILELIEETAVPY